MSFLCVLLCFAELRQSGSIAVSLGNRTFNAVSPHLLKRQAPRCVLPTILKSDADTNESHWHLRRCHPSMSADDSQIRRCGSHALDCCTAEVREFQFHKGLVNAFAGIR